MSNITNYLNKVKTAIYGKEVRGAIHDAIKQVYDDASVEHDNANMEVKLARGTHNTLNDRLDNVDEIQAQTNAQLSDISKLSIKITEQSNFYERLCNAINISSATGQVIEIASGEYELSETVVIDNPIRIRCNENVVIKSEKTFFNIKSSDVEITGNPNLKVDNSDISVITFNSDSNQTISDCTLEVLITKTGAQTDVVGILFETSTWHNNITINSKWLNTVLKFERTWHNGNKYFGKSLGFRKGIYFTGDSSGYGNLFNLEFEHTVDGVTCYGVITDAIGGGGIRNNTFKINHWVDNAIGKYYIYHNENHYFRDNIFKGQLEGLISDIGEWNFIDTNFYTERDREKNPNDMIGKYNNPLRREQSTKNYVENGNINFGESLSHTGFYAANQNITLGIVDDSKIKRKALQFNSNTTIETGYIVYRIRDFEYLKGKKVMLSALVLSAATNQRTDYAIAVQDGVNSTNSRYYGQQIVNDGEWQKITCAFDVSENAQFLQIELGRLIDGNSKPYYDNEILRFTDVMLIEGYYPAQEFVNNTDEMIHICNSLPTASERYLGKFVVLKSGGSQSLNVCIASTIGGQYEWKTVTLN